jgi:hypothetical protein
MTALYLGVVVLPLIVLAWNLGLGGFVRRHRRAHRLETPSLSVRSRMRRLRARPRALGARLGAAVRRAPRARAAAAPAGEVTPPTFEIIAADLPRSPSAPGWVPAQGYAAHPES